MPTASGDGRASRASGDCRLRADWPAARSDLAAEVVRLVNAHRRRKGLVALGVSPSLTRSAAWKASHMARYRYMRHDDPAPPVKRSASERARVCGYPIGRTAWGENIAYGYRTPEAAMSGWLRSRGHRFNIESARYTVIGVGAAVAPNGAVAWAQNFGSHDDSGGAVTAPGRAPRKRAVRPKDTRAPSMPRVTGPIETWQPRPTYRFASTDARTPAWRLRYRCSFDSPRLHACAARYSQALLPGRHVLRVQAVDATGNRSRVKTLVVTVVQAADLALTKSALPATFPGTDLVFVVTVANRGPWPADGVVVFDHLPPDTTLVSATATQGACSGQTIVTCEVGSLSVLGGAVVTVVVRPLGAAPVVNTASVSSATRDPTLQNNEASATIDM